MDIFEEISTDLGVAAVEPETPEIGMYNEWVHTKPHPKIYNCQYWLKHELHVYTHLYNKNWLVSKPNGLSRLQVPRLELARALLEYYFLMVAHTKFYGERHEQRGKLVDMNKFLDLVLEHPTIKKLIDDPNTLI